MSYSVIARKWRPQTFAEVVGQDHVVRTLENAIKSERIAQAYLFAGPRGTGKTTLARIFAKALNCKNGPTVEPCGECAACRAIMDGSSFDVSEIDGASNNKVDDVHARIIDLVNQRPVEGRYRIFYIDEVHMLTDSAFNALLKTLEEPPEFVKFIFATTEPDKVIGTVLSRCQRFDLHRISLSEITGQLRKICDAEKVEADDDALLAIARGADGGMRDAESALDQIIAFTGRRIVESDVLGVFGLVSRAIIEDLAGAILAGDAATILSRVDELDRSGKDLRRLAAELVAHFRNLLVCLSMNGDMSSLDVSETQRATLKKQAALTNATAILSVVEELVKLDGDIRLALSRRTLLETSLIRCSRAARVTDLETILRKLTELEKNAPAASVAPAPVSAPVAKPEPAPAPVAKKPKAAPVIPPLRDLEPRDSDPEPHTSDEPVAPWSKPVDLASVVKTIKAEEPEEPAPSALDIEGVKSNAAVKSVLEGLGGKIVDIR